MKRPITGSEALAHFREAVTHAPQKRPVSTDELCQWYIGCVNVAVGTTDHTILGPVLLCMSCAEKHELEVDFL